jgi:hypothetical protein
MRDATLEFLPGSQTAQGRGQSASSLLIPDEIQKAVSFIFFDPVPNSVDDFCTRFSFRDHGRGRHQSGTTFTWELMQIEDLKIENLVIDGWELIPYKYSEEFDDKGVLTIYARVELTEADDGRLRKMPMYFQVVRKGINGAPREMRFGQILWSKKENDEKYRIRFVLVDKAADEHGLHRGLFEPQFGNVADTAAVVRLRLSALLDKLVAKALLSGEEAEAIRTVDNDVLDKELLENDRVGDLDGWLGGRD